MTAGACVDRGAGDRAVGLLCAVHPDGVAAHVERQETLLRAGCRLVDAFPSRWDADPVRAAVGLIPELAEGRAGQS